MNRIFLPAVDRAAVMFYADLGDHETSAFIADTFISIEIRATLTRLNATLDHKRIFRFFKLLTGHLLGRCDIQLG